MLSQDAMSAASAMSAAMACLLLDRGSAFIRSPPGVSLPLSIIHRLRQFVKRNFARRDAAAILCLGQGCVIQFGVLLLLKISAIIIQRLEI